MACLRAPSESPNGPFAGRQFEAMGWCGERAEPGTAMARLRSDFGGPARLQRWKDAQKEGSERFQGFDSVVVDNEDGDGDRKPAEVLLVLEVLVNGDEDIEFGRSPAEQLAVADACPAPPWHGLHRMAFQEPRKLTRDRLIEENAHGLRAVRRQAPELPWPVGGTPTGRNRGTCPGCRQLRDGPTDSGRVPVCRQIRAFLT